MKEVLVEKGHAGLSALTKRTESVVYGDKNDVAIEQIRRPVKICLAVAAAPCEAAAVNPNHNGPRPAFAVGL